MATNSDSQGAEIRSVTLEDIPGIEALHARVFGPGRFGRTAYRVREGAPKKSNFCRLAATDGRLLAAVSFTPIRIGNTDNALLLGPLVVAPEVSNQGLGRKLIAAGLDTANSEGIAAVILVGDKPYYERFGFEQVPPGQIWFPGPVDPGRILAWQSEPGAINGYSGLIAAA